MRSALLALTALLLTGCGYVQMFSAPVVDSWEADVAGMSVSYHLVDGEHLEYLGGAMWLAGRCTIRIVDGLDPMLQVHVAAHELGHCLDAAHLGMSHNNFGDYGCQWGSYFCNPREGYAEGYADAYLVWCGYARSPLGLIPGDGLECDLPDPHDVLPQLTDQMARELARVWRP